MHKIIADMSISDVVKSVISGDMAKDLSRSTKIIVPTKRIEIRRTEVLEIGTPLPDEKAIVEPQASEEASSAQEVKPEEPSKQVVVEDVSEAGETEASESVEGEELAKDKEE
ncbi:MAG: hypothetical protein MUO18_00625 [Methanomassiliicoccales archaeon]|nr:hypothetical protein [Methanomassiliicoccales archaeon]